MISRVLVLAATAVGALALVGAASADAPVVTKGSFSSTTRPLSGFCEFPVVFTFVGTFTETLYFDDGVLVRAHFHSGDDLTVTNPANGKTLEGHEVINITAVFEENTEVRTGLPFHVNIPGAAPLLAAGRIAFDSDTGEFTVSGNFSFFEGDFGAFCAALA